MGFYLTLLNMGSYLSAFCFTGKYGLLFEYTSHELEFYRMVLHRKTWALT